MTEDSVWSADIVWIAGASVGFVVQRDHPALGHPCRQQSPRIALLSVAVPVRMVGVPVPQQQGVEVGGLDQRIKVVSPLVFIAWSNILAAGIHML